jgi:hypothetical protein
LLGIVAHSEDILRDINQVDEVRDAGLVIWTWGEDNNCKDTIKYLKSKGIHAIIYDKIDKLIEGAEKVRIFSFFNHQCEHIEHAASFSLSTHTISVLFSSKTSSPFSFQSFKLNA